MARYRLMLLDAPPRDARGLHRLGQALPAGVDVAAFQTPGTAAFVDPVLLGSGDDLAVLEAATGTLQLAGLAVCVIDDSTPWIKLVETIRASLGFTTVHVAGAQGAAPRAGAPSPSPGTPPSREAGPALRDLRDPRWVRVAVVGGALLMPMAGALLASTVLGDALYDDPTPASTV